MNADENKTLIGVYLRSSAAISSSFTASQGLEIVIGGSNERVTGFGAARDANRLRGGPSRHCLQDLSIPGEYDSARRRQCRRLEDGAGRLCHRHGPTGGRRQ